MSLESPDCHLAGSLLALVMYSPTRSFVDAQIGSKTASFIRTRRCLVHVLRRLNE